MKVFISSTSEDLEPYRATAADAIRDAQCEAIVMEHFPADPQSIIQLCREQLAKCDLVVLLQAFRRGWVPSPEQGGDGRNSITVLEISLADELKKPVLSFLADRSWPGDLWEADQAPRAAVEGFRNELNRNAKFFKREENAALPIFKALISQELANWRMGRQTTPAPAAVLSLLAPPPEPPLPATPYPLLQPYENPRTFAGRASDLDELSTLVRLPQLLLCLYATSGAGKSSLLLAGLLPRLRSMGHAVSLERQPGDIGLAQRLIRDLLGPAASIALADDDPELPARFAEHIEHARQLSGKTVVLIVDQLDDVLRSPARRDEALARLGPLLAATSQRLPGVQGFPCKWIFCYRQEFHGEMRAWLADVLTQARGKPGVASLPHDFSSPQKTHDWPVPVMGKLVPGETGESARRAFHDAIRKPLELTENGAPVYRNAFTEEGASRLAQAFAAARQRQPEAPLVPELQVVLNHLLLESKKVPSGAPSIVEVAEDSNQLQREIDRALTLHLERSLNAVFPGTSNDMRLARTRALIALRQLADDLGRRGQGLAKDDLAQMMGGPKVIARLSDADTRIIVDDGATCTLSHDRLAEAVANLMKDEALRGGLLVDQRLLDLQRIIGQKLSLYADTPEDESALMLTKLQRQLTAANQAVLLWDDARRQWWRTSEGFHRRSRQRRGLFVAVAILTLFIVGSLTARIRWTPLKIGNHWTDDDKGYTGSIGYDWPPDGATLLGGRFSTGPYVRMWDARTGALRATYEGYGFSRYGDKLLVSSSRGTATIIDIGAARKTILPFSDAAGTYFGQEGTAVLQVEVPDTSQSTSYGSALNVWSLEHYRRIGGTPKLPTLVTGDDLILSEKQRRILIHNIREGRDLWDYSTQKLIAHMPSAGDALDTEHGIIAGLAVSPDDDFSLTAILYDLQNGKEIRRSAAFKTRGAIRSGTFPTNAHRMAFSHDGSRLTLGGGRDKLQTVLILRTENLAKDESFSKFRFGRWLAKRNSKEGAALLSDGGADGWLWDLSDSTIVQIEDLNPATLNDIVISSSGRRFAALRNNDELELWDLGLRTRIERVKLAEPAKSLQSTAGDDSLVVLLDSGMREIHSFDAEPLLAQLQGPVMSQENVLGVDRRCDRINAWLQDGRVLRYSKELTVFGIRVFSWNKCPIEKSP